MKKIAKISLGIIATLAGLYLTLVIVVHASKTARYYVQDKVAEYQEDAQEAKMINDGISAEYAAHTKHLVRLLRQEMNNVIRSNQ